MNFETTHLYGLLTGVVFGFLLQQGRVLRYDKQLGALRLRDMTIVKFMLSSIIVGMIGVYALVEQDLARLSVKPTVLGANILGGLIFGIGWGMIGYCPGTAVGALGEGRLDAAWGIVGMLVGAAAYAEAFPHLQDNVLTWGNYGKLTFPELMGISPWPVIGGFVLLCLGLFAFFEAKKL